MKKQKWIIFGFAIGLLVILMITVLVLIIFGVSDRNQFHPSIIALLCIFLVIDGATVISIIYMIVSQNSKTYLVSNSMNYHIDKVLADSGVGVIIYDYKKRVVYESDYVRNLIGKSTISKKVEVVFNFINFNQIDTVYWQKFDKSTVEVTLNQRQNMLTFKDVTQEANVARYYDEQRVVIGEIEIDNFQYYRSLLNEEQLFFMQTAATQFLEASAKEFNFLYRQYSSGKYMIIAYEESLNKMIENEFKFIEQIQDFYEGNNKSVKLTLSIGISSSYYNLSELLSVANNALQLTQNRGGNQVTVLRRSASNLYFGSQSEISVDTSRTKINMIASRISETLKHKKIDKAFVYGHQISDLDSIGSSFGLWNICQKVFGVKSYIVAESLDSTTQNMIEGMKKANPELFKNIISDKKATEYMTKNSVVIMTDVNDPLRTEHEGYFKNINYENIFVIDHHRVADKMDFLNVLNTYVDPYASSASEIVTDIYQAVSKNSPLDTDIAQLLLNGIYTDTNKFRKATSSKTFDASSFLERQGAQTQIAFEFMKHNEESDQLIRKLVDNASEVSDGYFLSAQDIIMPSDTISIAADQILQVYGRKAAFVVAKINSDTYKLSIRSVNLNVQLIAESLGGGGHFNSAAVVSSESLAQFVDNIKQAIYSSHKERNESNSN